ncbi:MAG: hypothetical protein WCR42_15135 [bacterium]
MKKSNLLILFAIVLLNACSFNEKTIDTTTEHYRIFMFDNTDKTDYFYTVTDIENPAKDMITNANGSKIKSDISALRYFRDEVYFISPAGGKVMVYNSTDFKLSGEIDCTTYGFAPKDIAFHAGATSAFIIGKNSDQLLVVNLEQKRVTNAITLPDTIGGIAVSGPSIFVTLPNINKTVIIDNQTLKISTSLDIPDHPELIHVSADGNQMFIVAPGIGNYESFAPVSVYFYSYDVKERTLIKKVLLEIKPKVLATVFRPKQMVVTSKNLVYLTDGEFLISLDVLKNYRLKKYTETNISSLNYSKEFDGIFITKSSTPGMEFIELKPSTGEKLNTYKIYPESALILPLK